MNCGPTHHFGCDCHEKQWQEKLEKAERERDEAREQRDRLAALVGTIRHCISIPTRNVSDITPEEHSHEICAAIDAVNSQRDQLARALSSIIRFAELYEPKHKCVRDDLSLTIATAKNALKSAK